MDQFSVLAHLHFVIKSLIWFPFFLGVGCWRLGRWRRPFEARPRSHLLFDFLSQKSDFAPRLLNQLPFHLRFVNSLLLHQFNSYSCTSIHLSRYPPRFLQNLEITKANSPSQVEVWARSSNWACMIMELKNYRECCHAGVQASCCSTVRYWLLTAWTSNTTSFAHQTTELHSTQFLRAGRSCQYCLSARAGLPPRRTCRWRSSSNSSSPSQQQPASTFLSPNLNAKIYLAHQHLLPYLDFDHLQLQNLLLWYFYSSYKYYLLFACQSRRSVRSYGSWGRTITQTS